MFSDSHCHLQYLKERSLDDYLTAMKNASVHRAMVIMCAFDEYDTLCSITNQSDETLRLGMSVGLHPCQEREILSKVCCDELIAKDNEKVWAFGETGLDYYWDDSKKQAQQHSFAMHIHASQQRKKPVVVHTRAAAADTLALLKSEGCEHGIIHCFSEDYAFAKQALDRGLYLSLSGMISFKKATALQDTVKKLPKDRLLIETDSPYLAPTPKRGKTNEPAFVAYVAKALAALLDCSVQEIGRLTEQNFDRLLGQYE